MRKLFDGILLVCDMDGTLLNSNSEVSKENREALEFFVYNGGLFTIATGRSEESVDRYLPYLPVNVPAIVYNGAAVYDTARKQIVWELCLAGDFEPVLAMLMREYLEVGVEVMHKRDIYFLKNNPETDKHRIREALTTMRPVTDEQGHFRGWRRLAFAPDDLHIESEKTDAVALRYSEVHYSKGSGDMYISCRPEASLIDGMIDSVPKPWFKVLLAWEPEKLKKVELFLHQRIEDGGYTFRFVYSEPQFLEILHKDSSKGAALLQLVSMLDVDLKKTVAVGDNLNDIEMIQIAGTGIAVANAHSRLKQVADFCCCHHDRNAIAQVVNILRNCDFSSEAPFTPSHFIFK